MTSEKKNIAEIFEAFCQESFMFLEDEYSFKILTVEHDTSSTFITYQNSTTAIRISFEPREGGVFILLSRLINGNIPAYPILIDQETSLNSFYLDDLLNLKAPTLKMEYQIEDLFDSLKLENIIMQMAKALKKYAVEILKGNFQLFVELESLVKKRAEDLGKYRD